MMLIKPLFISLFLVFSISIPFSISERSSIESMAENPPSSSAPAALYIVYTEQPAEGADHESHHLRTLSSVLGRSSIFGHTTLVSEQQDPEPPTAAVLHRRTTMDPEIMQLLMECRQILAEMKVSTQRLAEKYQEYKQSETQMEESEEDLLSESSIAAQEKKMEVSIEDESQSEMKVTTQALQEKFHESKKSETKNESITKNETKNFIPKPLILPQISTTSPARPDIFISDNIIINGAELTQPNCYISDQAILSPTSNFSFSLSSFTSDLPPFSLPQFHFCSQSYPFAELQPFSYGAQIPTLLFNNPLNITSSTYDDGIFTLSLSSFECPSLTQSNSSYIEASAALTAKGYSLMTVALDLQLSQFEDDERVLTVFATVDSAMGGKSCNNSEWRLIWEKGKNAYHVFTKMTQRDLQNVSSLILLRDSE